MKQFGILWILFCLGNGTLWGCSEQDNSPLPSEHASGDADSDSESEHPTDGHAPVDSESDAKPEPLEDTESATTFPDWPFDDYATGNGPQVRDTDTGGVHIVTELPEEFTHANAMDTDAGYGGFAVVGPLDENAILGEDAVCANIIRVVVRDFVTAHTDFQDDWTTSGVEEILGADQKPVASLENNSKIESEWYRNVSDVNMPFAVDLWLEPVGETFVFDSAEFFPIDGFGFDETSICGDWIHNFHFTTELHAKFMYNGGESFTFVGDDDVYVFINNQLVVDLGGVHIPETGTIILDEQAEALSLEIGEIYAIDLFQAERQTCGSNFRIETTLDFSECGIILPDDIIVD